MEKTPMYAVVTPSHPQKRRWVSWASGLVSLIALIVATTTAVVMKKQIDRVSSLEETVLQMQIHMDQILQFTHEYLEYDEEAEDAQGGLYEELTVRGVVRKKRQATENESSRDGVPIYDQAYGVNLNTRFNSEGLRLYESFVGNRGEGDPRSDQVSIESTESGIKPYHKEGILDPTGSIVSPFHEVSNLWVPKKRRQRYPEDSGTEIFSRPNGSDDDDDDDDYEDDSQEQKIVNRIQTRHMPMVERRSRVKATERHDGQSPVIRNSVAPASSSSSQIPTVVEQGPEALRQRISNTLLNPYLGKDAKKKRPRKKQARRRGRRTARSALTLGHFVAIPANRTSAHHLSDGATHEEWAPAIWMDKLGLNRKYALRRGTVSVKESGLYYLYAQVLYEQGRFGSGYQIMVDGIPVMECSLTPSQPSHSCHTSGTTYLQRNAEVSIRDMESHMTVVRREPNSFFGLIKLMDAPETAEKLLLG